MSDEVAADLRTFLSEQIGSILQLELLLLLAADSAKSWNAEQAAKALYVQSDAAYGLLEGMRNRGLLAITPPEEGYRFAPRIPEWEPLVRRLADLYKERRLTVIDLIYSRPVDKLQSFADAFRFRRPT